MEKDSILAEKSLDFAVRIVNLYRHLMVFRFLSLGHPDRMEEARKHGWSL